MGAHGPLGGGVESARPRPVNISKQREFKFATILPRFAERLSGLFSVFVTSLAARLVFTLQKRITRYTWRWATD